MHDVRLVSCDVLNLSRLIRYHLLLWGNVAVVLVVIKVIVVLVVTVKCSLKVLKAVIQYGVLVSLLGIRPHTSKEETTA